MRISKHLNTPAAGRLALVIATLAWGVSFPVGKNTLNSIPVLWLLAFRFIGAALIFFVIAGAMGRLPKITRRTAVGGITLGVVLFAAYVTQTYGLAATTPGRNAFLTTTYCVITPFLCWALGKGKPDGWNILAAFVCLAGVGFISLDGGSFRLNSGDWLTLLCGVCFSVQILLTAHLMEKEDVIVISMLEFFAAGVLSCLGGIILEPFPTQLSAPALLSIGYLCVFCTALCFFLQNFGEKNTPPSSAAVLMSLEAVFGAIFSMALQMENMRLSTGIGFVLIFAAVLISETKLSFLKGAKKH